jgi:hypothetical protein
MRWWIAVVAVVVPVVAAADDPKPKPVDIKPFRDQLIVLADAAGGTYVVKPGEDPQIFFGTGKTLYAQVITGRSTNGDAWDVATWAPRSTTYQPGSISRRDDGSFMKFCGGENQTGLTRVTGDKAKAVLDKSQFVTTGLMHVPHVFLRDDAGTYYYVDALNKVYGGKGYRVFVGKKGAMKQLPLSDVAADSAGEVYATKSGDLRLTITDQGGKTAVWGKGEKKTPLIVLDIDREEPMIYRELGVYTFTGTICDDL